MQDLMLVLTIAVALLMLPVAFVGFLWFLSIKLTTLLVLGAIAVVVVTLW